MKNYQDFLLTAGVTVAMAKAWMNKKDQQSKAKLIHLIHHRFYNRYLKHVEQVNSGFLKMAISCLMIEALESFKQGIPDTTGKSGEMFRDFFKSESELFPDFNQIYKDFYKSVRCGILHQAETTNGWRILLVGQMIDNQQKAINAKKFANAVKQALDKYIDGLKTHDFEASLWKNAILKMEDVCENCKTVK